MNDNLKNNISNIIDHMEVRIDRRIVLLSIIELISNYKDKYPYLLEEDGNKKIQEDIKKEFIKFRNHKVIQLFNLLIEKYDFGFSKPIILFLQLKDDFTADKIPDNHFKKIFNEDKLVLEFINLLKEFSIEINFDSFYFNNLSRYKNLVNTVVNNVSGNNIYQFIKNYFGVFDNRNLVVNLIPWRTYGNYGTSDNQNIYTHLACHHASSDESDIYPSRNYYYSSVLVHEFSHSFINPLTDKYNHLFSDLLISSETKEKLRKIGYGSVDSIIKDTVVRAVTLRYILLVKNNIEIYKEALKAEKGWGFEYIESVIDSLVIYENNRDKYSNIQSFYLEIINNIFKINNEKNINGKIKLQ